MYNYLLVTGFSVSLALIFRTLLTFVFTEGVCKINPQNSKLDMYHASFKYRFPANS